MVGKGMGIVVKQGGWRGGDSGQGGGRDVTAGLTGLLAELGGGGGSAAG